MSQLVLLSRLPIQRRVLLRLNSGAQCSNTRPPNRNGSYIWSRVDPTRLRWYHLPLGAGVAWFCYHQYVSSMTSSDENRNITTGPWQVKVLSALPLKSLSRFFGWFNSIDLPIWLREPGFRLYGWIFGCNFKELADPNLKNYPNLSSFFCRPIKSECRPIARSLLTSPCDGRVLHFGVVENHRVEQVKGVTYHLDHFLGEGTSSNGEVGAGVDSIYALAKNSKSANVVDSEEFADFNGIHYSLEDLLGPEENKPEPPSLFFCVLYLAPGDYHRFHSPANWVVEKRRHFSGELFSVSPFMTKVLANLFILNERVALIGTWRHGFFSMVPVGATNVGSICLNFDQELRTNLLRKSKEQKMTEVSFGAYSSLFGGYPLRKGEEIGCFRLGSSIVLVFEAPANFKFSLVSGQKIQYGEPLGGT